MKSTMILDVEFLAGTDIESAVMQAKGLARQLNLAYACFSFNGVSMSIGRYACPKDVARRFREQLSEENPIVCCP